MPKTDMLINYVPGEECRIAIVEDGCLEELYHERASAESHVGNIYKGRVLNVEPSIQAAFIDFGLERNGFLHISDLHPMYFPGEHKEDTEAVGQKTPRRDRPPIQKCLRRGQEIIVQVLKEGIGTKGPTLTSYLSIPGRFLVMMPYMERLGVSRKVDDDEARRQMRAVLDELKPPEGFGFIIRTAGIGRTKTDLKRDLAYLTRLWKAIDARMKTKGQIGELYTESDLLIRTIRDVFSNDIQRVIVDDEDAARRARDFLAIASPRSLSKVMVYRDPVPLFHRYDIERQIENISARIVPLPSGGSLVIDSTEALVAIDVNSGKNRDNRDPEMTAYKTDMEAADEICRQLRLRDLGGVIVNDLIDMRLPKHRRDVEARFKNNLKRDRARTRVLSISQFGILEMTRQRMRPSINKSTTMDCPCCQGAGHVKNPESVVLDVMRRLALVMFRPQVARIELTVSPDVAFHLLNRKRSHLVALEDKHGKPVLVRVSNSGVIDFIGLACFDARGSAVEVQSLNDLGEPTLEAIENVQIPGDPDLDDLDDLDESEAAPDHDAAPADDETGDDRASTDHRAQADDDDDESRPAPAPLADETDDHDHDDDHDAPAAASTTADGAPDDQPADDSSNPEAGQGRRRRRRRRRRGGRGRKGDQTGQPTDAQSHSADAGSASDAPLFTASAGDEPRPDAPAAPADAAHASDHDGGDHDDDDQGEDDHGDQASQPGPGGEPGQPPEGGKRRRRRRRGGRRRNRNKDRGPDGSTPSGSPSPAGPNPPPPPPVRPAPNRPALPHGKPQNQPRPSGHGKPPVPPRIPGNSLGSPGNVTIHRVPPPPPEVNGNILPGHAPRNSGQRPTLAPPNAPRPNPSRGYRNLVVQPPAAPENPTP